MKTFEIEAKKRETGKKGNRTLAKDKLIPAIVYGHGVKNQPVAIPAVKFEKVFKDAGTNTLVWLKTDDDKKQVLIYDYQRDPITSQFLHVDFYAVNMKEQIVATVPLKFVGVSLAVKDKGGVLVKNMEEVKVKCFPNDLPHEIEVDLSVLNTFEDRVRVSDLKVAPDVEILVEDKHQVVANAVLPKEEKEEVGKPEENVQAVEGVKPKEEPAEAGKEEADKQGKDKDKAKK